MLPIAWSAAALDDLDNIIDYIADHDAQAAIAMHNLIESSVLPAGMVRFRVCIAISTRIPSSWSLKA